MYSILLIFVFVNLFIRCWCIRLLLRNRSYVTFDIEKKLRILYVGEIYPSENEELQLNLKYVVSDAKCNIRNAFE